MTPELLKYLCDPMDKSPLSLRDPVISQDGAIETGVLVSATGRRYPIVDGVPRFTQADKRAESVESFGDQWNYFNFDEFKLNWLNHTVKNTFGGLDALSGKLVVDCGAGSGILSRWMAEAGARHIIALELSHSVDGVMRNNLRGIPNVDIVQCSIDSPPIKDQCVNGIVICHNVIQHTPSVEGTARALWQIVGTDGELVFNCYQKNDEGVLRKIRLALYGLVRSVLSRAPFRVILWYARVMALLRFVPVIGFVIEKSRLMVRGNVPPGPDRWHRAYKSGVLNTFDCFGSHSYQHLKTDGDVKALIAELQPNPEKVLNADRYFMRPPPIGIALRLFR